MEKLNGYYVLILREFSAIIRRSINEYITELNIGIGIIIGIREAQKNDCNQIKIWMIRNINCE